MKIPTKAKGEEPQVKPLKVYRIFAANSLFFKLDILYTLRVWNMRPPFSDVACSLTEVKRGCVVGFRVGLRQDLVEQMKVRT